MFGHFLSKGTAKIKYKKHSSYRCNTPHRIHIILSQSYFIRPTGTLKNKPCEKQEAVGEAKYSRKIYTPKILRDIQQTT